MMMMRMMVVTGALGGWSGGTGVSGAGIHKPPAAATMQDKMHGLARRMAKQQLNGRATSRALQVGHLNRL
jgi:hypothetical protein